jgi:hypothetical protein
MSTNRSDQHCQPRFSNPTTEIHIRAIVCRANTNRHTQTVRLHSRTVRVRPNSLRVTPDSPVLGIYTKHGVNFYHKSIYSSQPSFPLLSTTPQHIRFLNTAPHMRGGEHFSAPLRRPEKDDQLYEPPKTSINAPQKPKLRGKKAT